MNSLFSKIKQNFFKKENEEFDMPQFPKLKITFFTGAGISADSGLHTYRASDGLWNNYPVDEVATSEAIKKDLNKVNRFFNEIRKNILNAQPNKAHTFIYDIQKYFDVKVVTQNIDDLHERSGILKENLYHLHGQIMQSRSIANTKIIYEQKKDIEPDERCVLTHSFLRPNVVFFSETPMFYNEALKVMEETDIVVVIGTSLLVNPAAMLVTNIVGEKPIYIIDPNPKLLDDLDFPKLDSIIHIQEKAKEGVMILENMLKTKYALIFKS